MELQLLDKRHIKIDMCITLIIYFSMTIGDSLHMCGLRINNSAL